MSQPLSLFSPAIFSACAATTCAKVAFPFATHVGAVDIVGVVDVVDVAVNDDDDGGGVNDDDGVNDDGGGGGGGGG
eukprot:CAMPEP_0175059892 /NCGR_PEP_ID=MMETSP0052_2-20121109/12688_1 /TAXON_ID=51329 ORGANISM="Polytomella parva, Strain SAG 63-3" /NCGR_SAMPLE_ID=MMETSP0052_2 /ASSEMBLY_ACC=CAM_ASM_000194 /LENGTH=75 /DNA_ID=CAMNT_0016325499 /DNA_START=84 /DNA_END=308 /DNA_ORIENTATION=-